jgi:folylpolyglutamate synthase/dihydropteroate synthase
LRGRIDRLSERPLIVADVGHNPDGLRTMAGALRRVVVGKTVTLFGAMKDKDHRAMVAALAPLTRTAVAVHPRTERALDPGEITLAFRAHGIPARDGSGVRNGLALALGLLRPGETLLIAGSHYVVGEAMDALAHASPRNNDGTRA